MAPLELIDYLSGSASQAAKTLDELVERRVPFGLTAVIFQEVLQGAATEDEFRKLLEYLGSQRFYGIDNGLDSYAAAARLYFRCRRAGITIRSTIDCQIAQTAIQNDLALLHNDRDYDLMAQVIPELLIYR